MSKRKTISHSDSYTLSVRLMKRNGQWGDWQMKGEGKWLRLEHAQGQIRMLKRAYNRTMEIRFEKDGKLLDYMGNEIGKAILYEKTDHPA